MLGLFGTLNLGARSLQTQQAGVEVTGHNLANVNNPAYARQRLAIQTSITINSGFGLQGTGADATSIFRLRNALVDQQIQRETSVTGSLGAQQYGLQLAQSALGQILDQVAGGTDGSSSAQGVGGQNGIAEGMNDLFNEFQNLANNPSSMAERQVLLMKAADLASRFNQTDQRLGDVKTMLDDSLKTDTSSANDLMDQIAKLNDQIIKIEASSNGTANDLRDTRQQKIEQLSQLVKVDSTEDTNGAVNISINGTAFVTNNQVNDTLETYDAGGGQLLVRAQTAGTPLVLTGGSMQGTIEARDGALATLRTNVNSLAALMISEVNTIHAAGYGLNGTTGAAFFTGSSAADIQVNGSLTTDPSLLQASGVLGAAGDNQVALALGQLADKKNASLNGQTFSQSFAQTVSALGQSLSSVNGQMDDQTVINNALTQQRDSVSGVSVDEEMTNLTTYQKAYEASAKLINVIDQMLETVMNMKQ